jgi:hypothetical protein
LVNPNLALYKKFLTQRRRGAEEERKEREEIVIVCEIIVNRMNLEAQ